MISKRLTSALILPGVVLSLWTASQFTAAVSLWFQGMELPAPPAFETSGDNPAMLRAGQLRLALAHPLFGRSTNPSVAALSEPVETIRKSRLNIQVLGIVAGPGQTGIAVLRHGAKLRSYAVGDVLDMQERVSIAAVLKDAVIIERNGRREKLELPGADAATAPRRSRAVAAQLATNKAVSGKVVDLNDGSIRKLIGDPVETITGNPMKLLRFMYAQPVGNEGYKIRKGLDGRLLRSLGLRDGDIVTAVNNRPARNLTVPDIQSMLKPGSQLNITFQRAGNTQQVTLSL